MCRSQVDVRTFIHIFEVDMHVSQHALGLTFWEYAITFDKELMTVWGVKMNATSILLISVRWVMIINTIITPIPASPEVSTLAFLNVDPCSKYFTFRGSFPSTPSLLLIKFTLAAVTLHL